MPFMYLALDVDDQGGIHASVKNEGSFKWATLGGPNSRISHAPFAVFQIAGFDGIDCLTDEELISELTNRLPTRELFHRMRIELSLDDLLVLIKDRATRG